MRLAIKSQSGFTGGFLDGSFKNVYYKMVFVASDETGGDIKIKKQGLRKFS